MENEFARIEAAIEPPDSRALLAARGKWNAVAKPIGSLGKLEGKVERIAALVGDADFSLEKRAVVVLCADNGVVAQGVSQSDSTVTAAIARGIARGSSSVCQMARACRVDAFSVDMGMARSCREPGVIDCHIARGTGDITQGRAMTRQQAVDAVRTGIELVARFKSQGYQLLATGEMGIGNTTTSSAMAVAFFGLDVAQAVGRGAGLADAGLRRKRAAVARALDVNRPDADDALDVLAKVGGFDIAGMAGMFIGGAVYRVPIVIDGFISAIAAYTAWRLCPSCRCAMLASHVSAEPASRAVLSALGAQPVVDAGMRLGEGTGAVLLAPLLDAALALYNGTTFEDAGIDAYQVDPQ